MDYSKGQLYKLQGKFAIQNRRGIPIQRADEKNRVTVVYLRSDELNLTICVCKLFRSAGKFKAGTEIRCYKKDLIAFTPDVLQTSVLKTHSLPDI